jgi:flagellar biosynthesis protein FlhB
MSEDRDQERNLPATPKRLEQAREEGQIARSRELATCLVLAGGAVALWWSGADIANKFLSLLQAGLTFDGRSATETAAMGFRLSHLSTEALTISLPILAALLVASLAAPMAVGGWIFSFKAIAPAWSRLNPLSGLSRIFSLEGLAELIKAVAKALLVGGFGAWLIWKSLDPMMGLAETALDDGIISFARLMLHGLLVLVAVLALVAAFDVPFQLYRYHSKLRMTLEEVKREARESEGDPQLKARIRSQQREMARRRMMAEVPKADVVITNPTHYAVALKYANAKMGAPQVIAKGSDLVAQRIRELARESDIPTVEAPPLARALYRNVEIGQPIPQALYTATAQVLAYVYHLRNYRQFGGATPTLPTQLDVPADLDIQGADL